MGRTTKRIATGAIAAAVSGGAIATVMVTGTGGALLRDAGAAGGGGVTWGAVVHQIPGALGAGAIAAGGRDLVHNIEDGIAGSGH